MTVFTAFKYHLRAQGFSLLEVLVAMGVMALVLVTLFRMHGSTLTLAGAGRFQAMIPPAVSQVLASVEVTCAAPDRMSEPFEAAFKGLSWTCVLEDAEFEEPLDILSQQSERFKKIQVTVTGLGRSHTIVTWRYFNEMPDD
jgi:prepilin-type N-terminal cleavage/methylation domain-containing protein